jgi:hypothetical protein
MGEIDLEQQLNQLHLQLATLQGSVDTFHASSNEQMRRMGDQSEKVNDRVQKLNDWISSRKPVCEAHDMAIQLMHENQNRMVELIAKQTSWIDETRGKLSAGGAIGKSAIAFVSLLCLLIGALGTLVAMHKG